MFEKKVIVMLFENAIKNRCQVNRVVFFFLNGEKFHRDA